MASRLLSSRMRRTVASLSNSIEQRCLVAPGKAHWMRYRRESPVVVIISHRYSLHATATRLFSVSPAALQSSRLFENEARSPLSETVIRMESVSNSPHQVDQDAAMDNSSMRLLFGMDRSLLQYLSDPNELEMLVSKIEICSRLTSGDVESWVHPLMLATGRLESFEGAVLTERLLAKCLALVGTQERTTIEDYENLPYPSAEMYNMAISAWTRARTHDGSDADAERATQLLEVMSEEYRREREWVKGYNENHQGEEARIRSPRPDIINYTTVMNAWAKSGTRRGILRAQAMLEELEQLSGVAQDLAGTLQESTERRLRYLTPDQACYNAVIMGWSRFSHPEAISRIAWLLQRMDALYDLTGDTRFQPDTKSFHMLINAYVKAIKNGRGKRGSQTSLQAAWRAENVLRLMYQRYQEGLCDICCPDIMVYNAVINAWANSASPDGAHRAETILLGMLGMASKVSDFPMVEGVRPNTVTFNTAIHAWARSGNAKAGERAERLFNLMESCHSDEVNPNIISFNAVMNAWSQSKDPDAGERTESILKHMIELGGDARPNVISFSTAIFAWARSSDDKGALRAELLLEQMERLYREREDESLQPNEACYEGVIYAWGIRSGNGRLYDGLYAAERAEAILKRMKEVGGMIPGPKQFNHVLKAWRKHDRDAFSGNEGPSKVQRASLLLHQMSASSNADVTSYNNVIATCTSPVETAEGKREALFTALDAYNRLCESQRSYPNNETYRTLFVVCTELLPSTSDAGIELFEKLFRECCNDGLLSNDILKMTREYLPPWSIQKLLGSEYEKKSIYEMPGNWSQNLTNKRSAAR